jgi:hypothetical protein
VSHFTVGTRVEAGEAEDYAAGVVMGERYGALSGNTYVDVQWDTGERTECLPVQLRLEGAAKAAAEREETMRHVRQTAEYARCGAFGRWS